VDGAEPFASAAVNAAHDWRFDPALHDGEPVAARVRFVVRFTEQPVQQTTRVPLGDDSSRATTTTATEPPASSDATEVVIHGTRRAPGAQRLTRVEARQLPGALGDPFRAIEVLPGVTPVASGLPYFIVRGAPPGNIGYFFDGIRVPLLFHVFFGPSVIHPAM